MPVQIDQAATAIKQKAAFKMLLLCRLRFAAPLWGPVSFSRSNSTLAALLSNDLRHITLTEFCAASSLVVPKISTRLPWQIVCERGKQIKYSVSDNDVVIYSNQKTQTHHTNSNAFKYTHMIIIFC